MMLLCCNPPSTGSNWTLGRCVVASWVGAVWICVDRHCAVEIRKSGEGRGTWHLRAVFVMRGTLPCMLLRVRRECVRFVDCSAHLVVGLGADMMGGHQLYVQAWEVAAACCLPAFPLQASPFVQAPFVWAPFVGRGEHMAPIADLLVGGYIRARGAGGYVCDHGVVLRTISLQQAWMHEYIFPVASPVMLLQVCQSLLVGVCSTSKR